MGEMESNERGLIAAYRRVVGERWDPKWNRQEAHCQLWDLFNFMPRNGSDRGEAQADMRDCVDDAIRGIGSTSTDEI